MKKMVFFLLLFLFPYMVFAIDKDYELVIQSDFIEYADRYEKLESANDEDKLSFYQKSNFSIRDYFFYRNIMKIVSQPSDLVDGMEFSVSEIGDSYSIQDHISVLFGTDYSTVRIVFEKDSNRDFNGLDFSSMDSLLDGSIYHYYLFYNALLHDSASLEFYKEKDYGKLVSKNTLKDLVIFNVEDGYLTLQVPSNVELADNTSFVSVNSSNPTGLDYVPIIFTHEEKEKIFFSYLPSYAAKYIMIGIVLLLFLLGLSFYPKKKKKN